MADKKHSAFVGKKYASVILYMFQSERNVCATAKVPSKRSCCFSLIADSVCTELKQFNHYCSLRRLKKSLYLSSS